MYFLCSSIYSQQFRTTSVIADLDQYYNNNGVAVADYDGDLDLDLFVVAKRNDKNNETFINIFKICIKILL